MARGATGGCARAGEQYARGSPAGEQRSEPHRASVLAARSGGCSCPWPPGAAPRLPAQSMVEECLEQPELALVPAWQGELKDAVRGAVCVFPRPALALAS